MGDTGMDWLHCTFKDSATPGPGAGPFLKETDTGYLYWVNTAHRKIVYYRPVIDNVDENGHGTHCAGSAVGSLQSGRSGRPFTLLIPVCLDTVAPTLCCLANVMLRLKVHTEVFAGEPVI